MAMEKARVIAVGVSRQAGGRSEAAYFRSECGQGRNFYVAGLFQAGLTPADRNRETLAVIAPRTFESANVKARR
jgi:hypothetical protein